MTTPNTDAERGLLACILIDDSQNLLLDCIAAKFTGSHFSSRQHSGIWEAINQVYDAGDPVDLVTVTYYLQKTGKIDDAGGIAGLMSVAGSAESISHARIWMREVNEARHGREIERIANLIQLYQAEPGHETKIGELIGQLQEAHSQAQGIDDDGNWIKSVDTALKRAHDLIAGRQSAFEFSSPFASMDRYAGKWQLGEYILIAGLSGGGKTALACNLAIHFARAGARTAFLSLEMSDWKLIFRMASGLCRIPSREIGNGSNPFNSETFVSQLQDLRTLETMKIYERKMDARAIEMTIRLLHKRWGLQIVFLDYVGLVEPYSTKDSREQQVARISRMIKRLTRELNIMIVALAQINTESEKQNRKPRSVDLRESQALRHDADRCYFVHKPVTGRPVNGMPGANQEMETRLFDVMYYVDKNRDNETGQMIWLKFFTDIQLMQEITDRKSNDS